MIDEWINDDLWLTVHENNNHTLEDADLWRGQSYAFMSQHHALHLYGQIRQSPVEASDRGRDLPQDGIRNRAQEQAHAGITDAEA